MKQKNINRSKYFIAILVLFFTSHTRVQESKIECIDLSRSNDVIQILQKVLDEQDEIDTIIQRIIDNQSEGENQLGTIQEQLETTIDLLEILSETTVSTIDALNTSLTSANDVLAQSNANASAIDQTATIIITIQGSNLDANESIIESQASTLDTLFSMVDTYLSIIDLLGTVTQCVADLPEECLVSLSDCLSLSDCCKDLPFIKIADFPEEYDQFFLDNCIG